MPRSFAPPNVGAGSRITEFEQRQLGQSEEIDKEFAEPKCAGGHFTPIAFIQQPADLTAEADSERGEDTDLQGSRRGV